MALVVDDGICITSVLIEGTVLEDSITTILAEGDTTPVLIRVTALEIATIGLEYNVIMELVGNGMVSKSLIVEKLTEDMDSKDIVVAMTKNNKS